MLFLLVCLPLGLLLPSVLATGSLGNWDNGLPCAKREFNKGIACVCNSTYCDTIKPLKNILPNTLVTYTTSEAGLRLEKNLHLLSPFTQNTEASFKVDQGKEYQELYGFGGAMTDAAGFNIHSLQPGAQENLLNSYFSSDGIEYSIIRVPIAGCDYSLRAYTYADEEDPSLSNFKLQEEDTLYKIPNVLKALKKSPRNIRVFASAWEAPEWMRSLNRWYKSSVDPKYYPTWADYHIKFVKAYTDAGIPIWALTTGNEPSASVVSMNWDIAEHQIWINNNLGPQLNSSDYRHVKLFIADDQLPYVPIWQALLRDPVTSSYVEGVATHWYLDALIPLVHLGFNLEFPNKSIFSSEACICEYEEFYAEETSWERAERYAENIVEKLASGAKAWVDWNMALDMIGGPNYVLNYCDAPMIVNSAADEFYKQAMFYSMAHFSKFIPPGSKRVDLTYTPRRPLRAIAFKTPGPSSRIVVVILNKNNKDYSSTICTNKGEYTKIQVPKRSIVTAITTTSKFQ